MCVHVLARVYAPVRWWVVEGYIVSCKYIVSLILVIIIIIIIIIIIGLRTPFLK